MSELVYRDGQRGTDALATGKWASEEELGELDFQDGQFWLGYAPTQSHFPTGYSDDRHICQVAGSRGGKGTTSIINNLCLWPGSIVVVDPKGENATVTARRRGRGSEYCHGMGQAVHILDPFESVENAEKYRARFNPLDAVDPDHDEAVDEAGRIADALVVVQEKGGSDPFWDESARALVKGIILHVLTDDFYEGRRNLITVRKLISRGDWESVVTLKEAGEEEIPSAYELLFEGMRRNGRYEGIIAGAGDSFSSMYSNSSKTFESVVQVANRNTEFIDSPGMRRCLEASDFALSDLKTDPKGVSLYLSLPQRYMGTHYRWLRMMIALTITEMEKVRQQPASGHRILMVLDEFAGLKRMEVIENAAAQIAGYGVKMWFVLQTLGQLKDVYKENWQTFLANSGLQLFAQIDDEFTKKYVSDALGETELTRRTQSYTHSEGTSSGTSMNTGMMFQSGGKNSGMNFLAAMIPSTSSGSNTSTSTGWSEGIHKTHLLSPTEVGRAFARVDETSHLAYPGLGLALVPGRHPIIVHKANYFEDGFFTSLYDPHPDHELPLTIEKAERKRAEDLEQEKQQRKLAEDQAMAAEHSEKIQKLRPILFAAIALLGVFLVFMVVAQNHYNSEKFLSYIDGDRNTFFGFIALAVSAAVFIFYAYRKAAIGRHYTQHRSLPSIQTPTLNRNPATIDIRDDANIQKSLRDGRNLSAIKEYRAATGCSLQEAKTAIKEIYGYDV